MEFLEGKCPKCSGMLQIPMGLDNLICMYCGKELKANEIITKKINQEYANKIETLMNQYEETNHKEYIRYAYELYAIDQYNYTANYVLACETLPKLLLDNLGLMSSFKANLYEQSCLAYLEKSKPVLEYVDRVYILTKSDKTEIIKEIANHFVNVVKENIDHDPNLKTNTSITKKLDDCKMVLALFLIPIIGQANLDISDELTRCVHEAWILKFPDYKISIGNYEDINNGFRKRKYCYITTAVCETLGKSDDCYELNLFRRFRDTYMMKDQIGTNLVTEYYSIAPLIVNKINSLDDKVQRYEEIWKNYLSKCIIFLEKDDRESCKEIYTTMVRELQDQYNTH